MAVWVEMGNRKQVPIFCITICPCPLALSQVSQYHLSIYIYSENLDFKVKWILPLLFNEIESPGVITYYMP